MEFSFGIFGFFLLPGIVGTTFLCAAAGLIGSLLFVTRRVLLGEVITHASYPGVLLGMLLTKTATSRSCVSFSVFIGGLLLSMLAVFLIEWLEKLFCVSSDAAHGFVLTAFFGLGILLAGYAQSTCPMLYGSVKSYLYGQSLTLTSKDALIAFVILISVILFLCGCYKELLVFCFDFQQAGLLGLPIILLRSIIFCFVALIANMGIKSMGVLLMSAVFVASPLAARSFTVRFHYFIMLSGIIGGSCAFIGNYFSLILPFQVSIFKEAILPPGPFVVLLLGIIAIASLLFSPKTGLCVRCFRKIAFKIRSAEENILKMLWKLDETGMSWVSSERLRQKVYLLDKPMNLLLWKLYLKYLCYKGMIKSNKKGAYSFELLGLKKVRHIVRLHRLWEVYLAQSLHWNQRDVHKNAEEIEHVLNGYMEKELTKMLNNPHIDPHNKIIPSGVEL